MLVGNPCKMVDRCITRKISRKKQKNTSKYIYQAYLRCSWLPASTSSLYLFPNSRILISKFSRVFAIISAGWMENPFHSIQESNSSFFQDKGAPMMFFLFVNFEVDLEFLLYVVFSNFLASLAVVSRKKNTYMDMKYLNIDPTFHVVI